MRAFLGFVTALPTLHALIRHPLAARIIPITTDDDVTELPIRADRMSRWRKE
jgi:hypothetical protein